MYQTVGHDAIQYYAECMDVPLYRGEIRGTPIHQENNYVATPEDETEDLYKLLSEIVVCLLWLSCEMAIDVYRENRKSILIFKACLSVRSYQITSGFEWNMCKGNLGTYQTHR